MKLLPAEAIDALNSTQEAFAKAYLVDKSASAAARAAGYSARSARLQGHRLLRRGAVHARIRELKAKIPTSLTVVPGSPEWIRERYRSIASVSAAAFVTRDIATGA